ncbi:hypothetical protein R2R35_08620 [Anaerocolumna sp. AGMB13020]|uniref:alpha/beta hydrolase family protein n=1 Tax=Anaerocolumna sp. AGMB13020 TaxID=3081750 RepID=UPI002952A1D4|nr:hypothetical protein [Anaerocolumna sp. AGMB13020]WOO38551.1 hypothetical protein R2R35_08620 [Anaerocolumna sp. AGMB13020]
MVSILAALILVVHYAMEGLRWQLFLPYCSTLVVLGVSVYKRRNKIETPNTVNIANRSIAVVFTLAMLLSTLAALVLPVPKLPKPSGKYEVGSQIFYFTDKDRDEIFTNHKNEKRKLAVQVWYPAKKVKNNSRSYLLADGKAFLKECAQAVKIPAFLIDYLAYTKSNSYDNCEVSSMEDSYPFIVMSHGMGTSRFFQVTQVEELASHGYIVASIDHTYNTLATLFPDGEATHFISSDEDSYASNSKIGEEWTKDILYTIDQFEKFNSGEIRNKFTGKIDMSNIGTIGHSFGGAAAYDSCYDNRIKAGINEDGSLYGYRNKEPLAKPFLFMYSEQAISIHNMAAPDYKPTKHDLENMGISKMEFEEAKYELELENKQIEATAKKGGDILYIKNTTHYNYTDLQLISPLLRFTGLIGNVDGVRVSYITNQYVLNFFNRYLKEEEKSSLFERTEHKYPEVKFISSMFDESLLK